jgi:hypothetical protein
MRILCLPFPLSVPAFRRRARRRGPGALDEAIAQLGAEVAEHEGVAARVRELEAFIASVPESVEKTRERYRDLLPPPDVGGDWLGRQGQREERPRLSRRRRRERRLRAALGALAVLLLLGAAAGLVALVVRLAATLGIPG